NNEPDQVFFPAIPAIRRTQAAAAWRNVLKLTTRPELQMLAHDQLAQLFFDPAYRELNVYHYKESLRLQQELLTAASVATASVKERFKALEQELRGRERDLKARRDLYVTRSANKPLMEKVRIARENGLPETTLDLLLKADPNDLVDAARLERAGWVVRLLLAMGRVDEAMQALTPDPKSDKPFDKRVFGIDDLGLPAYEWFRVQAGAATGNYTDADQFLGERIAALEESSLYSGMLAPLLYSSIMGRELPPADFLKRKINRSTFAASLIGDILLREAQQAGG